MFETPALNAPAELTFDIILANLDPARQAQVLDAVTSGRLTLVTKESAGATYEAFRVCGRGEAPSDGGCVKMETLDESGAPTSGPPATVRFSAVVGHFSLWAVAIVNDSAVTVAIDIKPGSFPNSINPRSKGVIPVAILTTDTFDATTVDPTTVRFGPAGTEAAPRHAALEDVDGDGDTDMILHFDTQSTGIRCGDTAALLTGETVDGQAFEGSDSIVTVCK